MHEVDGGQARSASWNGRRDPCEETNAVDWKRARDAARLAGLSECFVTDVVVERYAALARDVDRTRGV